MMEPAADLAAQLTQTSDRDEYFQAASETLLKLFPGLGAGRVSYDADTDTSELINTLFFEPTPNEVFMDHPLVVNYMAGPTTDSGIRRLSDFATDLALHRTRTYQEAFGLWGINRQITILTASPGPRKFRAWTVVRSGTDFPDAAMDLAKPIQTMLRLLDTAYPEGQCGHTTREAFSLTTREQEILQLLGRGLTGMAIGHLLGVSPRTVAKHLEHAYAKLGCTNRIDALRRLRGA